MAEPSAADIMKAILDLRSNFEARMDGLQRDVLDLKERMSSLEARVGGLEVRVGGLEARMTKLENKVDSGFAVIAARLDEQRSTLNALIPTRIAAVPPAAE